jgi:hypothetical protein
MRQLGRMVLNNTTAEIEEKIGTENLLQSQRPKHRHKLQPINASDTVFLSSSVARSR